MLVGIPDLNADLTIRLLNESGRDVVLVNSYGIMAEYLKVVPKEIRTFVFCPSQLRFASAG